MSSPLALPDSHRLDKCQFCLGAKGGVRGNENVFAGIIVCDYCTPLVMSIQKGVEAEGLPDLAHRCCVCQRNYVDSDAGYDTCVACLRYV